ncbi:hypothetical protein JHN63_15045 [Streptomyces sp. MBT65]|uniref:hypothetical protein n=1 Tax=Streptomyces sp. MBT65 TaxID=1488395 RepID=UPI001909FDEB|nr:hypothetical protein [Streptomyces sp. MBT65]MBK3575104.1 hypothetical protein [Streptomyces sp. MBT65]
MSNDIRKRALTELTQFEGAVFRFGHQVRAFLATFPEDLPSPNSVLPRFLDETTDDGERIPGGASYVHLVGLTEAGVQAWASFLGTQVTRKVTVEPGYVNVGFRAEGDVDGLGVCVGSSQTWSPEEWKQLQEAGPGAGSDAG